MTPPRIRPSGTGGEIDYCSGRYLDELTSVPPPPVPPSPQSERTDPLLMAEHCATRGVVEWVDCDDSAGHIECACGFVGRTVKINWLRDQAAAHLRIDVETFKAREAIDHPTVRWRP